MYLIKKSQVSDIAKELQKEYQVYGPVVDKETKQTMFVKADDIAEIDINPLIVSDDRPIAVDALVILKQAGSGK